MNNEKENTKEAELIAAINTLLEKMGGEFYTIENRSSVYDDSCIEEAIEEIEEISQDYTRDDALFQIVCLMRKYNIDYMEVIDRKGQHEDWLRLQGRN